MPSLASTALLNTLVNRDAISNATNATSNALHVVCAWPVSGQYGPGSRVLYYVLVAACVFLRKLEWLRNACLAAALLFPAVAAIHGIVLAAVHNNDAVDMDVFGAFQLCAIGVLAGPVTVKVSETYFSDPGRNTIFVWTVLLLAGLLSLTVEFYRITTHVCLDSSNNPISSSVRAFLSSSATCGLVCTEDDPISPIRGGSGNNNYVIPAPDKLTFGTATLLCAACCIPTILMLITMWIKILEINGRTRWGQRARPASMDEQERNTTEDTKRINSVVRRYLSAVEIPVFGAAVLAILIIGEMNLFSEQVTYQTEPMTSVGQWAPVVGTALAALGSLYMLFANFAAREENTGVTTAVQHCSCAYHGHLDEHDPGVLAPPAGSYLPSSRDSRSTRGNVCESPSQDMSAFPEMQDHGQGVLLAPSYPVAPPDAEAVRSSFANDDRKESGELSHTISGPSDRRGRHIRQSSAGDRDAGNRQKVANILNAISDYVGTPSHDRFADSELHGKALDFPEIPGEAHRNPLLHNIREKYNTPRDEDGNATPLRQQRSRAGSFRSVISESGFEGRAPSPQSPNRERSSSPMPPTTRGVRSSTLPVGRPSAEMQHHSSSPGLSGGRPPRRNNTLEVPSPTHPWPGSSSSAGPGRPSMIAVPDRASSPAIIISSEPERSSTEFSPVFESPTSPVSIDQQLPSTTTASPSHMQDSQKEIEKKDERK